MILFNCKELYETVLIFNGDDFISDYIVWISTMNVAKPTRKCIQQNGIERKQIQDKLKFYEIFMP